MAQLIQKSSHSEIALLLRKKLTSIGSESTSDVLIPTGAFSIVEEDGTHWVIPAGEKVRINGKSVSRKTELSPCDRLEVGDSVLVYHSTDSTEPKSSKSLNPLEVLKNISATLQTPGVSAEKAAETALQQVLGAFVEYSGAETGFLLTENPGGSEWKLVAGTPDQEDGRKRKQMLSSTVLRKTLETRSLVYVENIVGHPFAEAMSVMEARIFSVACFPFLIADRIVGAVFLYTRTPGVSLKRESLSDLQLIAQQVALLMAYAQENTVLKKGSGTPASSASAFTYAARSPMAEVDTKISKLAPSHLNLLIHGETGSGKEIAAKEIHKRSKNSKGPFVALNCAAIPATLLESTLFGHEKGAFTGAVRSQEGKFKAADGGTIFLDEIGDLSLELQAKLLRVLQERTVEPIGSNRSIRINVRVLAATHRNLVKMIEAGTFRQDLYYRLAGSTLTLPPLRKRRADIPVLARELMRASDAEPVKISEEAFEKLMAYPWPGNVRELQHILEQASVLCENHTIQAKDLELKDMQLPEDDRDLFWEDLANLEAAQMAFTRAYLERWLKKFDGNRAKTAEKLGISTRTLYRILSATDAGSSGSQE